MKYLRSKSFMHSFTSVRSTKHPTPAFRPDNWEPCPIFVPWRIFGGVQEIHVDLSANFYILFLPCFDQRSTCRILVTLHLGNSRPTTGSFLKRHENSVQGNEAGNAPSVTYLKSAIDMSFLR